MLKQENNCLATTVDYEKCQQSYCYGCFKCRPRNFCNRDTQLDYKVALTQFMLTKNVKIKCPVINCQIC